MINYSIQIRTRYVTVNGTKTKKAYAYAKAQDRDAISSSAFLQSIAKNSLYSTGVFATILAAVASKLIECVKGGYIVDTGAMGKFTAGLSSSGVLDIADFSAGTHIKKSYVKWTKPDSLAKLSGAKFEKVSTNEEAAALKSAAKNVSATATMPTSSARAVMRSQQAAIDAANSSN